MHRRLLLAGLLALAAAPARAADPSGVWMLDRKAWDSFVAGLVPKVAAKMPKAQRDDLEARGVDLGAQIRAGLSQGLDGRVELRPNGRVVALNRHGEPDGTGLWRNDGAAIEIDLPAERMTLQGTWQGDRMRLKPVLDDATLAGKGQDPMWLEVVRQVEFILLRQ